MLLYYLRKYIFPEIIPDSCPFFLFFLFLLVAFSQPVMPREQCEIRRLFEKTWIEEQMFGCISRADHDNRLGYWGNEWAGTILNFCSNFQMHPLLLTHTHIVLKPIPERRDFNITSRVLLVNNYISRYKVGALGILYWLKDSAQKSKTINTCMSIESASMYIRSN